MNLRSIHDRFLTKLVGIVHRAVSGIKAPDTAFK